jgi:hypothetical protein
VQGNVIVKERDDISGHPAQGEIALMGKTLERSVYSKKQNAVREPTSFRVCAYYSLCFVVWTGINNYKLVRATVLV